MQCNKYMKLITFKEKYSSLNHNHKHIVYHTLCRMKHSKQYTTINEAIYDIIQRKMEAKGIGYKRLYKELNKKLNGSVNIRTYESCMYRKTINGELFENICSLLNIPIHDILKLKKSILHKSNDTSNIDWLYNSLTEQDKKVIYYLASALYMNEYYPEVFDNNDN